MEWIIKDSKAKTERIEVVYHLFSDAAPASDCIENPSARENPSIPTVENVWAIANWHEREAYDMLGIRIEGHSDPRRILCPDDWVGFPLRKDYVQPEIYRGMPVLPASSSRKWPRKGSSWGQIPSPNDRILFGAFMQVEAYVGEEMILNMGPQHPSTHGVLRLELETDGEVVSKVTPHIGYLHRCFEKHAENVDYPGVIPYTDRMDYVAAMNNSFGYALAVERSMGIEVNERVKTLRVIMAELNRIASHLLGVGTYGMDIGTFTPFLHCFIEREKILDLFEWTCGARLLYNYNWVGGVSHDIPDGFVEKARQFLKEFEPVLVELNELLSYNKIFVKRTAGVGVFSRSTWH